MNNSKTAVLADLCAVIDRFADIWSDSMLAHDLAERLNCSELDALTGALKAAGHVGAAATWRAHHAARDEEGDAHYKPKEENAVAANACHYHGGAPDTFGIDVDKMCELHASELIRSISERKGIILQMIRSEDLYRHCAATLDGIPTEYHQMVIREAKNKLGWIKESFDDWDRVEAIIQNVASAHRLPTE